MKNVVFFSPGTDVTSQLSWNIITSQQCFQHCGKASETASHLGQNEELQIQLQGNEKKKKSRKAHQIKTIQEAKKDLRGGQNPT